MLPKRIFHVDFYPYGGHDEEHGRRAINGVLKKALVIGDNLAQKISELIAVAVHNRFVIVV